MPQITNKYQMNMKYKNYTLEKDDALNWKLSKKVQETAARDIKNPKTQEIIHKEGDVYTKTVKIGFYGDVQSGLTGIVKDLAGVDCADISQLASQLGEIKADLRQLLSIK